VSCRDSGQNETTDTVGTGKVEYGLSLSEDSIVIGVGEKYTIKAILLETGYETSNVLWTTSDPLIATVSASGVILGVSDGEATISVSSIDGKYHAECTVQVSSMITGIQLDSDTLTLDVGQEKQLNIQIFPSNIEADIQWQSSVESVATVSSDGLVTALSAGTTSIIAKTVDGNFTATCSVTVWNAVTSVTLSESKLALNKGVSQSLTVSILPENASQQITWKSSNESVASVDQNGMVTAVGNGTAVITATSYNGLSATCQITVSASVLGVKLNISSQTIAVGEEFTLTATLNPVDATINTVSWTSSNSAVASVSGSGVVIGKKVGTATITVKTTDGGYTASCLVTVSSGDTNKVTISFEKQEIIMSADESLTLTPTVSPANTSETFTWNSSDKTVASVNKSGKVTAKSAGTTVITVTGSSGASATVKIIVEESSVVVVKSISIDEKIITVTEGDLFEISVTVLPEDATDASYTFSFSDSSKLEERDGKLLAVSSGYVTVVAISSNGIRSESSTINIKKMSSTDKEHYIQSYQTAVSEEDDLNKSNVAAIHTKYDSSIASMESELQNLGISQSDYEARKVALENYQKEYDRAVQSGDEEKIQSTQQEIDQLSAEISQYETIRDKLNELNTQLDAELSEEDARHQTALKKIENDYIFIQQYL
jgi:uncharacterized protein YjdB